MLKWPTANHCLKNLIFMKFNYSFNKGLAIALCLTLIAPAIHSQTAKQIFSSTGIWQDYGTALSASAYPEFRGRLVNVNWSEIETAPNV